MNIARPNSKLFKSEFSRWLGRDSKTESHPSDVKIEDEMTETINRESRLASFIGPFIFKIIESTHRDNIFNVHFIFKWFLHGYDVNF